MSLSGANKDQMVTSLAILALYDGEAEITGSQIKTLLAATGNTVAPYWPGMFASLMTADKIEAILASGGAAGGASAAAAGPAAAGDAPAAAGEAPAAKPKVEEVDALEGGMD
eukprot:CAMPEP_0116977714 /NCGR_PEP_ID=MMETSP0467-20121206/57314_1 /TAXON_ID=283647 /ORGANISM="Mesodinium pulex, Strain SPMC105" /LENGTH=111 /DNA_ID=CAMNT_0004670873 /DNA_START=58 /DNA_END=390 /DNA_ORIENTATION=-